MSPEYVRYSYEHGHHRIPWRLSACANSVYQALSPPPPPRLGMRLLPNVCVCVCGMCMCVCVWVGVWVGVWVWVCVAGLFTRDNKCEQPRQQQKHFGDNINLFSLNGLFVSTLTSCNPWWLSLLCSDVSANKHLAKQLYIGDFIPRLTS